MTAIDPARAAYEAWREMFGGDAPSWLMLMPSTRSRWSRIASAARGEGEKGLGSSQDHAPATRTALDREAVAREVLKSLDACPEEAWDDALECADRILAIRPAASS